MCVYNSNIIQKVKYKNEFYVILNFSFCPNKIYRCVYTKNCAVVSITLFYFSAMSCLCKFMSWTSLCTNKSSVKSIQKCIKSLYNQPKPYFFKILLWSHFWIDFNKCYTKTFGIVNILIVYLLIMLLRVIFICTCNLNTWYKLEGQFLIKKKYLPHQ